MSRWLPWEPPPRHVRDILEDEDDRRRRMERREVDVFLYADLPGVDGVGLVDVVVDARDLGRSIDSVHVRYGRVWVWERPRGVDRVCAMTDAETVTNGLVAVY